MGQNHPKIIYNQQIFLKHYHEHMNNSYYSSSKTYGLKVSPINTKRHHTLIYNHKQLIANQDNQTRPMSKNILMPSVYPYSCIGMVVVEFKTGVVYRSGFLVGNNLVMTAATNIFDKQNMQIAEKISFALNVIDNKCDMYIVKKYYYHDSFIKEAQGSHRYNYALLEIESDNRILQQQKGQNMEVTPPGITYGYLGINTNFKGQENIYVYAFSRDKNQNNEIQFYLRGAKIDKLIAKSGCISYRMETCDNQTGSPIMVRRGEYYLVVGIHIGGKKQLSSGIQFNNAMRQVVNSWVSCAKGEICLSAKGIDCDVIGLLISFTWRNMMVINLDNNNLTNESMIILTKVRWPQLRELSVCENKLQKIEFDIDSIINLENLFLNKNQIKQIALLSQLPILHVLDLAQNKLEMVEPIASIKYLERLYLNSNKITKIPSEISRLGYLKKLYLQKNQFQTIPEEIMKLKQLITISLDWKAIRGKEKLISELQKNKVEVIINQ